MGLDRYISRGRDWLELRGIFEVLCDVLHPLIFKENVIRFESDGQLFILKISINDFLVDMSSDYAISSSKSRSPPRRARSIDGAGGAHPVRCGDVVRVGVVRRARQAPGPRRPRLGPRPPGRGPQAGPLRRLHVPLRRPRAPHPRRRLQPPYRPILRLLRRPRRVLRSRLRENPRAGEFLSFLSRV